MNVTNNSDLSQEDRWKKLQEWKQSKQTKATVLKSKENSSDINQKSLPASKLRRATEHVDGDKELKLKASVNRLQQELSESQSQLRGLQQKVSEDSAEISALKVELEEKQQLVKQYAVRYVPETLLRQAQEDILVLQKDNDELNDLLNDAQIAIQKKTVSEMELVSEVSKSKDQLQSQEAKISELNEALKVTLEDNEKLYMYIEATGPPVSTIDVGTATDEPQFCHFGQQTKAESHDASCQTQVICKSASTQFDMNMIDVSTNTEEPMQKKAKYFDEVIHIVSGGGKLQSFSVDPDANICPPKNQAYYAFGKYASQKCQAKSKLKFTTDFEDFKDECVQTEQDQIYAKAENTVKEFSTMKFANALMLEQMVQLTQKHRDEIRTMKKDSQRIHQYQEELTKHQRRLKQLLENKAQDEQRIKEMELIINLKQQENDNLVANINELMEAVGESDDDEE